MRHVLRQIGGIALAGGVLQAAPLRAQEPIAAPDAGDVSPQQLAAQVGARQMFTPQDFAQFAPRNALDMLQRVPGFTIQSEDDARGLGQASGNILINGARLTSKSVSARDQLRRIAMANVIRIEIADGASMDVPGLTGSIANIVTAAGGPAGQFKWRPQITTGPARPRLTDGEISLSGVTGPVEFTIALLSDPTYGGSAGPNFYRDDTGTLQRRINRQTSTHEQPSVTGNFAIDLPGSAAANVNLSYGQRIFRSREMEYAAEATLAFIDKRLRTANDVYNYEIGGDVDFAVGPGRLRLIVLESYEHEDFGTQAIFRQSLLPDSGSRYERLGDEGERIGRAEYRWRMLDGDWQVSGEAAFNRLDNVARLFTLDTQGDFAEEPFPGGTGGVREKRYEAVVSYGRTLTRTLSLQLTGGAESSRISQQGPNARVRSFKRPKGSLTLAWQAPAGFGINLEIARRVGQLDFEDFLARVNITEDNTNAGNNELRPQQSWETKLEIAREFGGLVTATLRLFDERIEDFVAIVPLPGGGESVGNVARARNYGYSLDATFRLDKIGFNGARLDVVLAGEKTSLNDPLTGQSRRFDSSNPRNLELDFRHDITGSQWAWGLEFRDTRNAPYYRLAEVGRSFAIATFGAAFVEHKNVLGMTVRARASNLFNDKAVFQRRVFTGPRDESPLLFSEDRYRTIGYFFNLDISGSF